MDKKIMERWNECYTECKKKQLAYYKQKCYLCTFNDFCEIRLLKEKGD